MNPSHACIGVASEMWSGLSIEWRLLEVGAWCVLALVVLVPRLKKLLARNTAAADDSPALRHLRSHDALTALPNRALLEQRVAETLALAERTNTGFAVVVLNLDRFNSVND